MRCVGSACGAWWWRCLRDYERRGNSLPREGLPLCVAPYFADLGVGDMRGRAVVSHPNRTPEVVRGCRIRHGVYRAVCQCCVV